MLQRHGKQLMQTLLDEYRGDSARALEELCRRYVYLLFRTDEPAQKKANALRERAVQAISIELRDELDR